VKEPKTRIGICEYHLCKKKTKVFLCKYCGKYFCKKHIQPKPVLSLRQVSTAKEPLRSKLEKIWRSEKGHPDSNFTPIFWRRFEKEEKLKLEIMWDTLNKLKELKKLERVDLMETKSVKETRTQTNSDIKIKNTLTVLTLIIVFIILALFVINLPTGNLSENHTFISENIIQTTSTTLKITLEKEESKKYFVDLNFSTPFPRLNKTFLINNFYSVYINDSLLKIIDPNCTDFCNKSIEAVKKAFKIWEEEIKLIDFEFVGVEKNHTIYVEITAEMPIDVVEKEFVSYAVGYTIPYGYECGNYVFVKGGKIYLSPKKEQHLLKIAMHEIGHILNLADVGNKDSIMCKWSEEEIVSEEELRKSINQEIKETLKMIVKPEYDCGV